MSRLRDDRGYDFGASPEAKAWGGCSAPILFILGIIIIALALAAAAFGLTPTERKIAERILQQAEIAKGANTALKAANEQLAGEAEQARINVSDANSIAGSAWASAFSTGLKANTALDEAARCKKENDEMRPIVAKWKKLQGPWWFPGINGLLYFAGKSLLSLVVIIVGAFVIFLIIKVAITLVTGGTFSAGLGVVGGIFGRLGRWFVRAGKRLLSFFRKRGKAAVDNIEHRTIGSEPEER